MKINDDHMYFGAALMQIAEHQKFTSINGIQRRGKLSSSAFKINNSICAYLKYATAPKGSFGEYVFTFTKSHLDDIKYFTKRNEVFVGLVCLTDREICCVPFDKLKELIQDRKEMAGQKEDSYQVLVTLNKGQSFRVYMNKPHSRGELLKEPIKVSRNQFPNALFK